VFSILKAAPSDPRKTRGQAGIRAIGAPEHSGKIGNYCHNRYESLSLSLPQNTGDFREEKDLFP